jgi:hypothetical protein
MDMGAKDAAVRALTAELESMIRTFIETQGIKSGLTGAERRRLVGAGIKNYDFIARSFVIARENPQFMPPNFDVGVSAENMRDLENIRQLVYMSRQFAQFAYGAYLVQADSCYRLALRVYGSLQEQARNKVAGARALFEELRKFFIRRRRAGGGPSEMKAEKDFKRLVRGKADGEIIVENESPGASGGVHVVTDSVHRQGRV